MPTIEYSFVTVPVERHRDGLRFALDHRAVIRERAAEGWRLVQMIPLETHAEPRHELVFSRKVASK